MRLIQETFRMEARIEEGYIDEVEGLIRRQTIWHKHAAESMPQN